MEIALPMPDTIGRLQKRICTEFALVVEEWSGCIQALTLWEDEHLLDGPSAENLAHHKQTIERLLKFGRFISLATDQEDFPDNTVRDMVDATQQSLRDKLAMWHGPQLSEEQSNRILAQVF